MTIMNTDSAITTHILVLLESHSNKNQNVIGIKTETISMEQNRGLRYKPTELQEQIEQLFVTVFINKNTKYTLEENTASLINGTEEANIHM